MIDLFCVSTIAYTCTQSEEGKYTFGFELVLDSALHVAAYGCDVDKVSKHTKLGDGTGLFPRMHSSHRIASHVSIATGYYSIRRE